MSPVTNLPKSGKRKTARRPNDLPAFYAAQPADSYLALQDSAPVVRPYLTSSRSLVHPSLPPHTFPQPYLILATTTPATSGPNLPPPSAHRLSLLARTSRLALLIYSVIYPSPPPQPAVTSSRPPPPNCSLPTLRRQAKTTPKPSTYGAHARDKLNLHSPATRPDRPKQTPQQALYTE